mmetsp:Transcript_25399/g.66468  ORF Transcript_25399/g.66468 Transcript_25399/m.66468 type:complete len:254 (+) Transcript_25399:574-1335(+)
MYALPWIKKPRLFSAQLYTSTGIGISGKTFGNHFQSLPPMEDHSSSAAPSASAGGRECTLVLLPMLPLRSVGGASCSSSDCLQGVATTSAGPAVEVGRDGPRLTLLGGVAEPSAACLPLPTQRFTLLTRLAIEPKRASRVPVPLPAPPSSGSDCGSGPAAGGSVEPDDGVPPSAFHRRRRNGDSPRPALGFALASFRRSFGGVDAGRRSRVAGPAGGFTSSTFALGASTAAAAAAATSDGWLAGRLTSGSLAT